MAVARLPTYEQFLVRSVMAAAPATALIPDAASTTSLTSAPVTTPTLTFAPTPAATTVSACGRSRKQKSTSAPTSAFGHHFEVNFDIAPASTLARTELQDLLWIGWMSVTVSLL